MHQTQIVAQFVRVNAVAAENSLPLARPAEGVADGHVPLMVRNPAEQPDASDHKSLFRGEQQPVVVLVLGGFGIEFNSCFQQGRQFLRITGLRRPPSGLTRTRGRLQTSQNPPLSRAFGSARALAVMVVVPLACAITFPSSSTAATTGFDDSQTRSADIAFPLASRTLASNCRSAPAAVNKTSSCDSAMLAGLCSTVTAAEAETEPLLTVTVAVPLSIAVTSPFAFTETMDALEEPQPICTDIVAPFWSLAVACSCAVASSASRVSSEGETVILVSTG